MQQILFNSKAIYADLTQFDSSQCTSFKSIFQGCNKLTSLKLGKKFLTSNAVDMSDMFNSCGANNLNYFIDFSKFDTSKVSNMYGMFRNSNFKYLDLRSFDTSEVTTMEKMFSGCRAISIDLSSFDTSKVINMQQMFSETYKLISLDISNFNFDKGEEFSQMFYCINGMLKLCCNQPIDVRIQKQIEEAKKTIRCNDPCFLYSTKKIVNNEYCVKSCQDTKNELYEYDNECYISCPSGTFEHPQGSFMCIDILNCSNNYYSYDMKECIDVVPEGFYCNNKTKKTIDKCPNKCKACNLESMQNHLCVSCNINNSYFPAENYPLNINNYIDCFNNTPEGYYLDNSLYKKCYKGCKYCYGEGNSNNHKCKECKSNMILELESNCYEKCSEGEYYYFDDSNNFHCQRSCPDNYKKIIDKGKCINDCRNDSFYIFQFENTCLDKCPENYFANYDNVCVQNLICPQRTYYNYTQTGCIDSIPVGFYLNDSIKRTIDKCDIKCEKDCILDESANKILCKGCNEEKIISK